MAKNKSTKKITPKKVKENVADIWAEIEYSRLERENAKVVMHKGFTLFFVFLFTGVMGFVGGMVTKTGLTALVLVAVSIFVIVSAHEMHIMLQEENRLQKHINKRIIADEQSKRRRKK